MSNFLGRMTKPDETKIQEGNQITNGLVARRKGASKVDGLTSDASDVDGVLSFADGALQRAGFGGNDQQAIRFAIAQNVQELGAGNVVDQMRTRLQSHEKFRKKVLTSYATLGEDAPEDVLKRLDDLDRIGAQNSIFGMTGKFGGKFVSGFNIDQSIVDEQDLMNEINVIAGPALSADKLVEHQKSLANLAKIQGDNRKTKADTARIERDNEKTRVFGLLDNIYTGASTKQLVNAANSGAYSKHGVPADIFGEYVMERLEDRVNLDKKLAEIRKLNADTSKIGRDARNDAVEEGRTLFIGSLTDDELEEGVQALQSGGTLKNAEALGLSLRHLLDEQGSRAKGLKDHVTMQSKIAEGYAAVSSLRAKAQRLDEMESLITGVKGQRHFTELTQATAAIKQDAKSAGLAEGTNAFDSFVTNGYRQHYETVKLTYEDARKTLVDSAGPDIAPLLLQSEAFNKSVTLGDTTSAKSVNGALANYISKNVNRLSAVDPNHGLSGTSQRWGDALRGFNASAGLQSLDLNAGFETSPTETLVDFLKSPSGQVDGKGNPLSVKNMLRSQYEGDVKSHMFTLALRNLDQIAVNPAQVKLIAEGLAPYVDKETGTFSSAFLDKEGDPNIRRILLETHQRELYERAKIEDKPSAFEELFGGRRGETVTAGNSQRLASIGEEIQDRASELAEVQSLRGNRLGTAGTNTNVTKAQLEAKRLNNLQIKQAITQIGPRTQAVMRALSSMSELNNPALTSALVKHFEPIAAEEIALQSIINPVRQVGATRVRTVAEDGIEVKEDRVVNITPTPREIDLKRIIGKGFAVDVQDGVTHFYNILNEINEAQSGDSLAALTRRIEDTRID